MENLNPLYSDVPTDFFPTLPTVTPTRKNVFTPGCTPQHMLDSAKELQILKINPLISPRAREVLENLLDSLQELAITDSDHENYDHLIKSIATMEMAVASKLEHDSKYQPFREEFQKLLIANIRLRYGDYIARNLKELKNNIASAEKTKTGPSIGQTWSEVWKNLQLEEQQLAAWKATGELGNPPSAEFQTFIKLMAEQIGLELKDVIWQIREYAERCNTAHVSNIDTSLAKNLYYDVATFLTRDKRAIEKNILNIEDDEDRKSLLRALDIFEKSIFTEIDVVEVSDGIFSVVYYKLTDKEEKRRAAAKAQKDKEEALKAGQKPKNLKYCQTLLENISKPDFEPHDDAEIEGLRQDTMETYKEYEKAIQEEIIAAQRYQEAKGKKKAAEETFKNAGNAYLNKTKFA